MHLRLVLTIALQYITCPFRETSGPSHSRPYFEIECIWLKQKVNPPLHFECDTKYQALDWTASSGHVVPFGGSSTVLHVQITHPLESECQRLKQWSVHTDG